MISHIDLSASRDSLIPVILGTSSASLAANTHSEAEHSSLASIGCRPRAGHCRLCTTSLDQVQALTQLQTVCSVCQVYRLTCGAPLDGALECPAFFFFFDAPRRKDLARSDHESPGMSRTAVGGSTSRLTRAPIQKRSVLATTQCCPGRASQHSESRCMEEALEVHRENADRICVGWPHSGRPLHLGGAKGSSTP